MGALMGSLGAYEALTREVLLSRRGRSYRRRSYHRRRPKLGVQVDHAHDERGGRCPVSSQHLEQVERYFRKLVNDADKLHWQMLLSYLSGRELCVLRLALL